MASKINWDDKDPDEIDDRILDWSARLPSTDSINTSEWFAEPETLVCGAGSIEEGKFTRVVLSAGEEGIKYEVLNRITTAEGRTLDQTVLIKITTR